jgi:pimeloyl-ACP methyl ester carboxylesterase
MSHARWWDFAAPRIAALRGEVFAMDPSGHGDSDWLNPPSYSSDDQLHEVCSATATLCAGPWAIGGHSRGGLLAASLAATCEPWIRALVLVDVPAQPTDPRLVRAGRRFRAFTQPRFGSFDEAVRSFRVFPDHHRGAPAVIAHLARESVRRNSDGSYTTKFDWRFFQPDTPCRPTFGNFDETLRRIECPVLCVRGTGSTILTAEQLRLMSALIPQAEAVEIPDSTHHPHIENPEAVADAIVGFLTRHHI